MFNKIKEFFSLPEGLEKVKTPKNVGVIFVLMYKELPVGVLALNDGVWSFHYTDAFKSQDEIKPIIDFPDIEKDYNSEMLWPFFATRLPSLNRPSIQKIIQKEKINKEDMAALLERFGAKTITSPYTLTKKAA